MSSHSLSPIASLAVFAALLVLLALTVAGHNLNWGLAFALGIAACKAALVALFFMHLRWDSPVVQAASVSGLLVLLLLQSLTLSDYLSRGWFFNR